MAHITPELWGTMAEQAMRHYEKEMHNYKYNSANAKMAKFSRYDGLAVSKEEADKAVFTPSFYIQKDVDKLVAEAIAWHTAEIATLREALLDHGDGHLDVLDWEELTDDEP